MTGDKCIVFLVVLTFLWTAARGDVHCIFMESCILPCSFDPGPNVVIHWMRGNKAVHSYYHNTNQLSLQDQRYRGRTSLFESKISSGNASLQLKKVELQDGGQYKCYASTIKGNLQEYFTIIVKAPVSKVNIEQTEDSITCSSNGIYPQPELLWSTKPQSNVTIMNQTVHQTERQVYTVRSSLLISDHSEGLEYICNVATEESHWKATVRQQAPVTSIDSKATIPCIATETLRSLVWKFNYSQIIRNKTGANIHYGDYWKQKVKEDSESNNLELQNLSSHDQGIYTCELTTAEETYIINTFLNVPHPYQAKTTVVGVVVGVVVVVLLIVAVAGIVARLKKRSKRKKKQEQYYDAVEDVISEHITPEM